MSMAVPLLVISHGKIKEDSIFVDRLIGLFREHFWKTAIKRCSLTGNSSIGPLTPEGNKGMARVVAQLDSNVG